MWSFPFKSQVVSVTSLKIPKAKELAAILSARVLPFVELEECRLLEEPALFVGYEVIVLNVEVELGQVQINQINKYEKIAIAFDPNDAKSPEVLALREDFPVVTHLNLRDFDFPKSLCLYDSSYEDVKIFWTPTRFIERVRQWLSDTAKGTLHKEDQLLEPLFIDYLGQLVLPFEYIFKEEEKFFDLQYVKPNTLIADEKQEDGGKIGYLGTIVKCAPQQYGVINKQPRNLNDLNNITKKAEVDLVQTIQSRLRNLDTEKHPHLREAKLMVTIIFPKKRGKEDGKVENNDVWSFLFSETIKDLGVKLGVWEISNNKVGLLLQPNKNIDEKNIKVTLFRTIYSFNRDLAAIQNGYSKENDPKIVLIGAGTLGSQMFMNVVKSGFGSWTIIDNDILLPHNLARHALPGCSVGSFKSEALAQFANITINGMANSIVADVLKQDDNAKEALAAISDAEIICDCSASLPVLNKLAKNKEIKGRIISMFLNPTGIGLVVFKDDDKKEFRMDHLEMQYLRQLIYEKNLNAFLSLKNTSLRYANSCRDVSSRISQEDVAIHAAICSDVLKNIYKEKDAAISVWLIDSDRQVKKLSVPIYPTIEIKVGKWTIITDEFLLNKVKNARASKLPNETGGILIGSFNVDQNMAYIVDTVLSPPDSVEWPTVYVRGSEGLQKTVESIKDITLSGLEYVGEWHSHPDGCSSAPSDDDRAAFVQLNEYMGAEGLPAIMLIIGGKQLAYYLGNM